MTAETARKYAWLEQLSTEELEGLLHAQAISADSEDLELTDLIRSEERRVGKECL